MLTSLTNFVSWNGSCSEVRIHPDGEEFERVFVALDSASI